MKREIANDFFSQQCGLMRELLEDEISRVIFDCLFEWYKERNIVSIQKLVEFATDMDVCFRFRKEYSLVTTGRPIIIYGCGTQGKILCAMLKENPKIFIFAFCDKNSFGNSYMDYPILDIEECKRKEDAIWLIPSAFYKTEMYENLIRLGIKEDDILIVNGDFKIKCSDSQYFDPHLIKLKNKEVFVDCGAADGIDSERFLLKAGIGSKSIMIEPDKRNIEILESKLGQLDCCSIINKGVWSSTRLLKFFTNDNLYAGSFSDNQYDGEEATDVSVVALDDIIHQEVTLLKMDIEGSEMEALKGAKTIIKKNKPRCAICIYHKPEHLYEIGLYLKSLVPEYKFYLRHYSNYNCETVLYAIVEGN